MIQARRRKELLTKKEKLEQYAEKIHLAKLIISDIDGVVLVDRRISPGATQFTLIPDGPSSRAKAFVSDSTAPFVQE